MVKGASGDVSICYGIIEDTNTSSSLGKNKQLNKKEI